MLNAVIFLDVYTTKFFCSRLQVRNFSVMLLLIGVSHLFLKRIWSSGLDHCAMIWVGRFSCPAIHWESWIEISIPGNNVSHKQFAYLYVCRLPLMIPLIQVSDSA